MAIQLKDLIAAQRELKAADSASLSIAEFRKMVVDSEDSNKRIEVKLQKIVDASAKDKEVQLSVLEEAKANKDIRPIDVNLLDEFKQLGAKFDKSNSNTAKLFEEAKKQTAAFQTFTKKQLTDNSVKAITDKAASLPQFKTIGERVGDVKDNIKKFFTVKGFLNKTGIVDEKSDGIFATMVNRRQAKKDYVQDRLAVDPQQLSLAAGKLAKKDGKEYSKLSDSEKQEYKKQAEPEVKASFAKKFDEQQSIQKDMRANQKDVNRLKDNGFSDEKIKGTAAGKKQAELAEAYAKVDTRAKDLVEYKEPTGGSTVALAKSLTASEEVTNEAQQAAEKQSELLHTIVDNTEETNKILSGGKKDKKEKPAEESKGKGIFDTAKDALSNIASNSGIGKLAKKVPGVGKLGKNLLKGAKGFGIGAALGIGGDLAADYLGRDTKAGAGADILGKTASYAGTGALIGSVIPGVGTAIGGAIGGVAGLGMGLYDNFGTLFGSNKAKVTSAKSSKSYQKIAGEEVVPGQKLSKKQMAIIAVAKSMGNSYSPEIEKQYAAQKAESVTPTVASKSEGAAVSPAQPVAAYDFQNTAGAGRGNSADPRRLDNAVPVSPSTEATPITPASSSSEISSKKAELSVAMRRGKMDDVKRLNKELMSLETRPKPVAKSEGAAVYNQSAETAGLKEKSSSQPIVVAPVTNNSSNSSTQVTKYDLPTRKDDGSLNRYTGSRLAY